jgi:hypothetical protein
MSENSQPQPSENHVKEMEQRLSGRVLEPDVTKPKNALLVKAPTCESMTLSFDSGKWILCIPFKYEWQRTFKSGNTKNYPATIKVMATHCPLCGTPIESTKGESQP